MSTRVFIPNDTAARSMGADDVAHAIAVYGESMGLDLTIVRNGSRGAAWLEPLVEVETTAGRVGFGNVMPNEVDTLFVHGQVHLAHDRCLGTVESHPWFAAQQRITFRRAGVIDPLSLADYEQHGGLAGVRRALTLSAAEIVADITTSGLRGRGGAAFPAGIKWNTVRQATDTTKYIECNADEGASGTFADRLLIEADPYQLLEGMIIAGLAVGAERGYVYLRSEYPWAITVLREAVFCVAMRF